MAPHHFPLLIIFSLSLVLPSTFSDLAADRSALLRLRAAIGGRTRQWNTSSPSPCSWNGVTCDNSTNPRVISLRLPGDGLTGQLPLSTIGNLTELRFLSLRRNSLSGPIPFDLSSCTRLQGLYLQENSFSGEIPESFFTLRNLIHVNLARNNFSGTLPSGFFTSLPNLRSLYLENNQFSGSLPDLGINFVQFNVSFNGFLTGQIPSGFRSLSASSFLGTSLCGTPLPSCPNRSNGDGGLSAGAIAGIAVGSFCLLVLIVIVLFVSWRKRSARVTQEAAIPRHIPDRSSIPSPSPVTNPQIQNNSSKSIHNSSVMMSELDQDNQSDHSFSSAKERSKTGNGISGGLVFFGDDIGAFSLDELLRASAEVMGKGTVGSTYKAYMESGTEVIVKRLKNVCVSEKEFRGKMEEMGSLVHENLEPIRGYFYGREEKLLVYNPVPGGSLSALLHGDKKQPLSWEIRARIARGAARGIEYLHSVGLGSAHGNIKSANIFITDYYQEVRVAEFGLTQLVSSISNLSGHRAPEVTNTRKISQPADVYSFGILLLELLTGKAPDDALIEDGIELPKWVQSIVQDKWTIEVFDPDLLRYENLEEEMVQLLHLAVSCTAQHPERRPPMVEVRQRIEEILG